MSVDKLYLIAGHGAGDSGACGNGYQEQERVRKLVACIKKHNEERVIVLDTTRNWYADRGINSLTLPKNCALLECHMDSAGAGARGGHVIIPSNYGGADEYDKALAKFIGEVFAGRAQLIHERSDLANPNRARARGINYRLVEFGFISDAGDVKKFNERMDEIAVGVLRCFGLSDTLARTYTGAFPKLPKRGYFIIGDGKLRLTSYAPQIKKIQRFLNWAVNSNLDVNGEYTDKTKKACLTFQQKAGMIGTHGNFGTVTLERAKTYKK